MPLPLRNTVLTLATQAPPPVPEPPSPTSRRVYAPPGLLPNVPMQSHSCQRVLASSKTTKSKQRLFHFSLCRNHFISTSTSLPLPLPLLPLLFHFHFNFISTLSFLAGTIFLGLRIEIQWSFFTGIPYIFLIFILYVYVWWGCFLAFLFYDSGYHPVSNPFIHCFLGFLVPLAFCFPFCNYTRGSVHDSVFSFFCKFSIFCGC